MNDDWLMMDDWLLIVDTWWLTIDPYDHARCCDDEDKDNNQIIQQLAIGTPSLLQMEMELSWVFHSYVQFGWFPGCTSSGE